MFPAEAPAVRDRQAPVRLLRYRNLHARIAAEQLTIPVVQKPVPNKDYKIATALVSLPPNAAEDALLVTPALMELASILAQTLHVRQH